MPAQIPALCWIPALTEKDLQDTDMCVTQAHDAKKGPYRMVEPDHFPSKLFDRETAGILRCLPITVLTKFSQAWEGDGVKPSSEKMGATGTLHLRRTKMWSSL